MKRLACLLVLMVSAAAQAAERAHVVLLHVNDVHGQTQGRAVNGKPAGGYPRLSTAVTQIRKEVGEDRVLLIHAGDEFSRGDELTTQTLGAANVALMNQIGFSVWTPGNGEFYSGAPNLQKRISEARFPVLAANISYRMGGQHLSRDTVVLERDGVRLGFLGLCFIHKEHPSSFVLKLDDPVETARRVVPDLRKLADVVVAVDHIGYEQDKALAAAVSGIDLIIGGHSHTVVPRGTVVENPDGTPVLVTQAGEHLQYLGRIDLELEKADGTWRIISSKARLIALDSSIPEDPAVKATIAKWSAALTTRPASQPAGAR